MRSMWLKRTCGLMTVAACLALLSSTGTGRATWSGRVLSQSDMDRLIGGAAADLQCGPVTCTGNTQQAPCDTGFDLCVRVNGTNICRRIVLNNFQDCNVQAKGWTCTATQPGTLCGDIREANYTKDGCDRCTSTGRTCGESTISCNAHN
jgi:hypothetical protein